MQNDPRPTKAERRELARLQAERLRAEQARKAKRQRSIVIGSVVAAFALVTIVIVLILNQAGEAAVAEPQAVPQGSTERGAIPVGPEDLAGSTAGAPEDAVVVAVYSDYLCSYCALFEQLNGPVLDELRESGDIVVHYYPVAIMDYASADTEYSTRAATATAMVADQAPEAFLTFHHALMANQPTTVEGFSDEAIAAVAEEAGVPEHLVAAIASGEYMTGDGSMRTWVTWLTDLAGQDLERLATPTILLDGEQLQVDWRMEGALAEAIAQARG